MRLPAHNTLAAYAALFIALGGLSVALEAPVVFWAGFLGAAWLALDRSLGGTAGRAPVLACVTTLMVALQMVGGPVPL